MNTTHSSNYHLIIHTLCSRNQPHVPQTTTLHTIPCSHVGCGTFLSFLIDYYRLMDLPLPSSPLLPLGTEAENQHSMLSKVNRFIKGIKNMATTHSEAV